MTPRDDHAETLQLETIDFHGDQLQAVRTPDNKVFVSIRRVCEALGINEWSQQRKLQDAKWASTVNMTVVDPTGRSREQTMLPLDSVPMWLSRINSAKVAPGVRDKLDLYQIECRDVLAAHFGILPPRPKRASPTSDLQRLEEKFGCFDLCVKFAERFGLVGNQALLCADKGYRSFFGESMLTNFQVALPSPGNERMLTATEIGEHCEGLSAIKANKKLEAGGFQVRVGDHWEPTEKGKPFSVLLDTGKQHGNGTPIQQLKWRASILPFLTGSEPAA